MKQPRTNKGTFGASHRKPDTIEKIAYYLSSYGQHTAEQWIQANYPDSAFSTRLLWIKKANELLLDNR